MSVELASFFPDTMLNTVWMSKRIVMIDVLIESPTDKELWAGIQKAVLQVNMPGRHSKFAPHVQTTWYQLKFDLLIVKLGTGVPKKI